MVLLVLQYSIEEKLIKHVMKGESVIKPYSFLALLVIHWHVPDMHTPRT